MKVFVTGMGAITSLGHGSATTFAALVRGESGIRAMPEWRTLNGLHSYVAAPAVDYDVSRIPRAVRRSMSRMSEMAAVASHQALAHADLQAGGGLNERRVLLAVGSTIGSPQIMETYFRKMFEKNGPEGQLSTSFFKIMSHSVAANVAASLDFNGALLSPNAACATSTQALILGWEMIRSGSYDIVIAGGADELHSMSVATFDIVQAASRAYNDRPEESSRPFDAARDGLVVSEGAGVVVLESESSVCKRGVRPLAEILGGAYWSDSSHMSQSSAATMAKVMQLTLERAGLKSRDVDYVNAHATGTVHGDAEEAKAIGAVFGEKIRVSSLKGHLGHSFAACGAIEAMACIEMMNAELLLPTRNLREVGAGCEGVTHIREISPSPTRRILSSNFAFGGLNTSLLISKV